MRNEPQNAAQKLADGNPIRTKKSPGWRLGQEAVGAGVPGGNSSAPFPDTKSAVLSPSTVSSQSRASQPAHAYSRLAHFGPAPRRNIRNKLSVLDSLMRAQSLFAPMADHRPRSSYESDNVPWSKAVARRATRSTIGQELKALYQVPQDLATGNWINLGFSEPV
jgi:hypothetical protein